MSKTRYVTANPEASQRLSRTANAIMLLLYFNTDMDNLVDKQKFIKKAGIKLEQRTWNKYWTELERQGILARTGIKTWMLSPYQCYAEGRAQNAMITKWNEAQHAIS